MKKQTPSPSKQQKAGRRVDVAIVGAGISGLSAALFLKQKGLSVLLLEKEERPGGNIRTEEKNGFLIEYGPNSIMDTTPALHRLIEGADVADELLYAGERAQKRYILRGGRLRALPTSLPAFIKTDLFTGGAKRRLLREPFIKPYDGKEDESLAAFVVRRLGREFLDYAINPFVAGVYAGAPERLSVRHGFPKLYRLEQKYGSLIRGTIGGMRERRRSAETAKDRARMFSFRHGLGQLIGALAQKLEHELVLRADIGRIDMLPGGVWLKYKHNGREETAWASQLLLTVPARAYAYLPLPSADTLTETIGRIYYPPVSMVFLGYAKVSDRVPSDGFGFLVPAREQRNILGTLWSSSIFSGRAPQGGMALTTFVGGSRQPQAARQSAEELIAMVRRELRDIMGLTEEPAEAFVKPWPRAIPQYEPGYDSFLNAMETYEKQYPRIRLGGNFRNGISVADCVKQAWQLSEELHRAVGRDNHAKN